MKNKLEDLNNHLFAQLERLSDEELVNSKEKLEAELARTKAVTAVAREIVAGGKLVLDAHKAVGDRLIPSVPPMLGNQD